jgi:hypothetical protein
MRRFVSGSAFFVCVLLAPAAALAQASIVGAVRDSSGAVLPESPSKPQAPRYRESPNRGD